MTKKTAKNEYEILSEERKRLQATGDIPEWMTTAGWQMFKSKYLYQAANVREQFERIARTAAHYAPKEIPVWWPSGKTWYTAFFDLLWSSDFCLSTPVLSNTGTNRGCSVSCAGSVVEDSVIGFYDAYREVAALSKEGFGTASDLSGIRGRGSNISKGGKANGVVPVFDHFVRDSKDISQGSSRRGAWAGYLDIEHDDFYELAKYIFDDPDGKNVGWIIKDSFIKRLNKGDKDAHARFQEALTLKLTFGRGYFFFVDKVNRRRPKAYVQNDLYVRAAQLCNEIHLHSSEELTYSCILGWMNDSRYDKWDKDAVFVATVFMDSVVSDFLEKAKDIEGLEKVVEFTRKGRAIGIGQGGLHTLFQKRRIPFESLEAQMLSNEISRYINQETLQASKWLAAVQGEPEWCKGLGERFTHRTAIAPTKSTALIYGGLSEGINPDVAMSFTQLTSAGEVQRVNPELLALLKEKGLDIEACIKDTVDSQGSVQHVDWLTDEEKAVFKTAFEINQRAIIRMASSRQRNVCQGQSLNLFFGGNAEEREIAAIHKEAFMDELTLGLYYIYSNRGIVSSSSSECAACM